MTYTSKHKHLLLAVILMVVSAGCSADESTTSEAPVLTTGQSGNTDSIDSSNGSEPSQDTSLGTVSVETTATASDSEPASSTTATGGGADGAALVSDDLPANPADMAAALTAAEMAVRKPDLPDSDLDAWGRRQQALYRHLSFHPDWVEAVQEAVDPSVSNAVALNWEARENLAKLLAGHGIHDTLPAWRVVAPPPPDELIGYYKKAEAETGIPWEFVAAINLVETRMGRIQGVSTAGAIGPMQFLPTTWEECCEGDPTKPEDAIIGAATYLTVRGGPENMAKALWGYNNSDFYVNAVTAYASVMMEDERAYYGYHAWEIYFLTTEGLIRIPVGYEELEEVAATEWLAANPELLISG